MPAVVRSVWTTPRAPHPPGPLARDWVLVGIVVVAALLEGILRTDVTWRPAVTVAVIGISFTLPWRRVHPFGMFAIAFGGMAVLQVVSIAFAGGASISLASGVFVLLLVYAVFRWGSGRECVAATLGLIVIVALGFRRDYHSLAELLAELAVLTIPALAGVAVRAQVTSRARALEQVRLSEREQLARELHDTVAHHVSAMVVRAQAGQVVGAQDPSGAMDALAVIEKEGSRTLAEMRVLVGALRDTDDPELLAPKSAADIRSLADSTTSPVVDVTMVGDADALHPAVGSALFRIAQESVTNARRHAVHATHVHVDVAASADVVRIAITDDGDRVSPEPTNAGFGIVGMRERVTLLGGTLVAGPAPQRGWIVEAVIPTAGVHA